MMGIPVEVEWRPVELRFGSLNRFNTRPIPAKCNGERDDTNDEEDNGEY